MLCFAIVTVPCSTSLSHCSDVHYCSCLKLSYRGLTFFSPPMSSSSDVWWYSEWSASALHGHLEQSRLTLNCFQGAQDVFTLGLEPLLLAAKSSCSNCTSNDTALAFRLSKESSLVKDREYRWHLMRTYWKSVYPNQGPGFYYSPVLLSH